MLSGEHRNIYGCLLFAHDLLYLGLIPQARPFACFLSYWCYYQLPATFMAIWLFANTLFDLALCQNLL